MNYETAPASRVAAQRGLPAETVRRMDKRVLRRWASLDWEKRQTLRGLFALNRRLAKAYLLKEQLAQIWTYTGEGAARRCLTTWLVALRWQRLPAFQKLGRMLTRHLDTILNYCHEKAHFLAGRPSHPWASHLHASTAEGALRRRRAPVMIRARRQGHSNCTGRLRPLREWR